MDSLEIYGNNNRINGNNSYSFLKIEHDCTISVYNLIMANCTGTAIYMTSRGSSLNIENSEFINNNGEDRVISAGSRLTIQNCNFINNTASAGYVVNFKDASSIYIQNSRFTNNTDGTRDMLFSDAKEGASINIHDNEYNGNYLETNINPKYHNLRIDNLPYAFPIDIKARDIYSIKINKGNLIIKSKYMDKTTPVSNGVAEFYFQKYDFQQDNTTVYYSYLPEGNDFQAKNTTDNILIEQTRTEIYDVIANNGTYNQTSVDVAIGADEGRPFVNETVYVIDKDGNIVGKNRTSDIMMVTGDFPEIQYLNIPVLLPRGTHDITVKHDENIWYDEFEYNTTITVYGITPEISAKIDGNKVGKTNITVNLTDPDGKTIKNATVIMSIPDLLMMNATTDENGIFNGPIYLPEGTNKVDVLFEGNYIYDPAETNVTKIISKNDPSISAEIIGDKVGNTTLTATLTDSDGTPLKNATITVILPNGTIMNVTTDENGKVNTPIDLREGTDNINIIYNGNDMYYATKTNQTVIITKNNPILKLTPFIGIIGEDITLSASVTDENNNPITGGNLVFKLNGKTLRSDGRFDSDAPAMKIRVENGNASITIKADTYLRNTKNLTASYSGTYKFKDAKSESVEAQIQKRQATITIQATPTKAKQYENITFTAKVQDTTPNSKNTTLINQGTQVLFKVNGNAISVPVTQDNTATYTYTIPAGQAGINSTNDTRNYKAEAILNGTSYYTVRNDTTFNVERSNITIDIADVTVNNDNVLSVKASIKDYKDNNVVGTNKVIIKINGISYVDSNTSKVAYWNVTNGNIDLTGIQVDKTTTIKRVMIVTGQRQAYLGGRNETTNIMKV